MTNEQREYKEQKWTRDRALDFLKRNGHVPIDKTFELAAHDTPGLGCWGAIDYLRSEHGFDVRRQRDFREADNSIT